MHRNRALSHVVRPQDSVVVDAGQRFLERGKSRAADLPEQESSGVIDAGAIFLERGVREEALYQMEPFVVRSFRLSQKEDQEHFYPVRRMWHAALMDRRWPIAGMNPYLASALGREYDRLEAVFGDALHRALDYARLNLNGYCAYDVLARPDIREYLLKHPGAFRHFVRVFGISSVNWQIAALSVDRRVYTKEAFLHWHPEERL